MSWRINSKSSLGNDTFIGETRSYGMGGAVGTDSTAVAVPLLSEIRQDLVLPYHVLVKTLKDVRDLSLLI